MSYINQPQQQVSELSRRSGEKLRVVFEAPGRSTPGFLKRMDQALMFQEVMRSGLMTREVVREMVEFLADFIKDPADREEAKQALWEASQDDFDLMMSMLSGQSPSDQEANQKNGNTPAAGSTE